MTTAADLKSQTVKELSQLARKWGVAGYSGMRKDELVQALLRESRKRSRQRATAQRKSRRAAPSGRKSAAPSKRTSGGRSGPTARQRAGGNGKSNSKQSAAKPTTSPSVLRRIRRSQAEKEREKNLAAPLGPKHVEPGRDSIVLLVLDPFWLQACWDVTHQAVSRVRAAMAEKWHGAVPMLRLLEVDRGPTTGTSERVVRDIRIHGGVRNWYIDVQDAVSYQVCLGYLAEDGQFFTISRSNIVTPPEPGSSDTLDENWQEVADDYDRIYALSGGNEREHTDSELRELFEERLRRPMGAPVVARFGIAGLNGKRKALPFEVDAELIVYGSTSPDAHVTLSNEPLKLRPDGTFTVRMSLPDRRQVIPVVATSHDGIERRTIVLAVERNTKTLDPIIREEPE